MLGLIWALVLFVGPVSFVHSQDLSLEITEGPPGARLIEKDGDYELRVDSGSNLKIACKAYGEDLISVLWLGTGPEDTIGISFGEDVLATDKNKYSINKEETSNGANFILGLSDLNLDDEMSYSCQSGKTVVMQLYVTTKPNITSITPLQTATAGEEISLECRARGSPPPVITWRHTRPNNRLPNGIEGSYKKGINLDISSITVDDRGEYECIASNGVPNDENPERRTTFIRMDYAPDVNAIVDENPVVKAPEGEATSLTCRSMSYPRSTSSDVVWYFEDEDVSEFGYQWDVVHELPSEDPDPYEETTYSVLQIPEVNANTTGQYKCQFKNARGNDHALIELDIGETAPGATTTTTRETVTYKSMMTTKADDDDDDKRGMANNLSASLVTVVTMLSAIFCLGH